MTSHALEPGSAGSEVEIAAAIRDLTRIYFTKSGNPVIAISQLSLDLRNGEVLSLIGPSGCGKSSLLRILSGLDRDFSGSIEWSTRRASGRAVTATVFQTDSLFPWLTIESNVKLPLRVHGIGKKIREERTERYLRLAGLSNFRKAYPHELSGGMRQRAAVARALAMEPLLLLMDEPFAALDAQTRIVMQQEMLRMLAEVGPTVLYVTHDLEEALTMGHRVALMSARPGRIRELRDVDFGPRTDVMAIRSRPGFGRIAEELWRLLAAEVGQTLG